MNSPSGAPGFASEEEARTYLESVRWPHGVTCPHCGGRDARAIEENAEARVRPGLYRCGACQGQFTVTVGTIFERSHVSIRQWLVALYLLGCGGEEVTIREIQEQLELGSNRTAILVRDRLLPALEGSNARTLEGLLRHVLKG